MGVPSEVDLERASGDGNGGAPADIEMVRFLREEIRTAVQHELNSPPTAPPSYDSTAPLLIEDPPAASPSGDTSAETQDVDKQKQKPKGWRFRLEDAAFYGPYWAVIVVMFVFGMAGIDNLLEVKLLALCLVVTMYLVFPFAIGFYCCARAIALRCWPKTPTEQPGAETLPSPEVGATAPTEPGAPKWKASGIDPGPGPIPWHFLFCYLAFIGIVYCWASMGQGNNSLLGRYRAAEAFDSKFVGAGGLERFVKCLEGIEEIQGKGRLIGLADAGGCLMRAGINITEFVEGALCVNLCVNIV